MRGIKFDHDWFDMIQNSSRKIKRDSFMLRRLHLSFLLLCFSGLKLLMQVCVLPDCNEMLASFIDDVSRFNGYGGVLLCTLHAMFLFYSPALNFES